MNNMATACQHPTDWCHVCGTRTEQLADIWYPRFAETGTGPDEYIRICANCADVIGRVARGQLVNAQSRCFGWGTPPSRLLTAKKTRRR